MNKNKKIILAAVALIAVLVIVAGAAAAIFMGGNGYDDKVALGYRYLEQGDFNNAYLAFQEAISIDGTREEAYIGMYNAYVTSGNAAEALRYARAGASAANSSLLNSIVMQADATQPADPQQQEPTPTETAPAETTPAEVEKLNNPILNEDMLGFFNMATYGDYTIRYGTMTSTVESEKYQIRLEGLPATLVFFDTTSNRVIDTAKGVPYNIYQPNEIRLDNVMILFGGVKEISYTVLKNLSGVSGATKTGNTINFKYNNCDVTVICDDNEMVTSTSQNSIVPSNELVVVEKSDLSVTVLDATTGMSVADATVKAYAGYTTSGTPVEGKTDGSGNLVLELTESGVYTLEISKEGFITELFEAYILTGQNYQTFSISPVMPENVIRFVLTWSASPTDLDSYLVGTSGNGTSTNCCYYNKYVSDSQGNKVAELDVDDVNGFGPETTTLYDTEGTYEFVVVDFTGSGTMSYSQAQVKIYVGSELHSVVDVPAGLENGWQVCRVVNGEVTVTNVPANTEHAGPK